MLAIVKRRVHGAAPMLLPMQTPPVLETGSDHALQFHIPHAEPPPGGFPLVWLLDAPTTWAPMRHALDESGSADSIAVVGIGWEAEGPVDQGRRRRDFTLPAASEVPGPRGGGEWGHDGDCGGFLELLAGTLQPRAVDMLPVDPRRQVLVGHSLSGLFALHALMTGAGTFAGYVAASPSIWWDDARILDAARSADWSHAAGARVLVTVGSEEQRVGPERPASVAGEDAAATLGEPHMVDNASLFAELLRSRGLDCRFELFEGEGHGTVLPFAMAAAVELVGALPATRTAAIPTTDA